jgi:hypothetical protein
LDPHGLVLFWDWSSGGRPRQGTKLARSADTPSEVRGLLFYELPNGDAAVNQAAFYPCDVDSACHLGVPWGVGWITAMFFHASWDHTLGSMLFLAIFGKNVEDAFGRLGYLVFYFAGGFAAAMMQTAMTLLFGSASDAQNTHLGGQRRDRRRHGRPFFLYPDSRISTLVLWFPVRAGPISCFPSMISHGAR